MLQETSTFPVGAAPAKRTQLRRSHQPGAFVVTSMRTWGFWIPCHTNIRRLAEF
jgi:hypothetical protein